MPTLIELSAKTRLGGTVGIFGAQGLVTTWYVATDAVDDSPVSVLSTPGNGGVVIGQAYPWYDFGVVAIGYVERERVGPKEWEVDVLYGPPIEFPTNDWVITTSGSVEVREELTAGVLDENGNPVIDPVTGTPKRNPIGPRLFITEDAYKLCKEANKPDIETGMKWVARFQGDCRASDKLFMIRGDSQRRVKGISVTRAVGEINYSCVVTQLNKGVRQSAQTYLNTVNDKNFDGYEPWTMKCIEIIMSRRQGIVEGQPVTNVVHDISVRFQLDYGKHMPITMYDTYIDDNGTEVFVEKEEGGARSFTEYFPYGESNFVNLLNLFLPPRNIPGGR